MESDLYIEEEARNGSWSQPLSTANQRQAIPVRKGRGPAELTQLEPHRASWRNAKSALWGLAPPMSVLGMTYLFAFLS